MTHCDMWPADSPGFRRDVPGFGRGGEASPRFCSQAAHILGTVSVELAPLSHLHTTAMKFSVFFGFSGCKAWPAEPLSPHTFPHFSELQSTGKASPALHCGTLSTLGGTQAGYKGEQIQEVSPVSRQEWKEEDAPFQ